MVSVCILVLWVHIVNKVRMGVVYSPNWRNVCNRYLYSYSILIIGHTQDAFFATCTWWIFLYQVQLMILSKSQVSNLKNRRPWASSEKKMTMFLAQKAWMTCPQLQRLRHRAEKEETSLSVSACSCPELGWCWFMFYSIICWSPAVTANYKYWRQVDKTKFIEKWIIRDVLKALQVIPRSCLKDTLNSHFKNRLVNCENHTECF